GAASTASVASTPPSIDATDPEPPADLATADPALLIPHVDRAPVAADRRGALLADLSGADYAVRNLGRGVVGSAGAGVASALLGIGGGIIKVPLMHLAMGVPLRVATATSNLMIGITAAASAVIYLLRGEIDPYVAGPTAIGVFLGATLGSRVGHRIQLRYLRMLFIVVLLYTAVQMLLRAAG
ncbi:MAG TPA: sulfite exporter TauE/SafE family protein, partial [Candidatus Limnocylindrales bacterium]